jgi:hypothetical protein
LIPTHPHRIQRLAVLLNHLSWAAVGLSVLGAFLSEVWSERFPNAPPPVGFGYVFGFLFLLAILAASAGCVVSLVFGRTLASAARREPFLALGFLVFLLILVLLAPSFIDALARSERLL